MGLLKPHERHGRGHGPADMNERAAARKETNQTTGGLHLSQVRAVGRVQGGGRRVLVRVDFNVPIENGVVADTTRLTRVLPTIAKVAREGGRVVVLSHLGRPKGQPTPDTSLRPVAAKMQELMPGIAVRFAAAPSGDGAQRAADSLTPGGVAVLEHVRYNKGEEKNDREFAKSLAALGDLYVNDAFSSSHRAHASLEAITDLLPSYAGLLMMAEITALGQALERPERQ